MFSAPVMSVSGRMIDISSPPKRAGISVARQLLFMTAEISRSTLSPARWPWVSLMVLKRSRSIMMQLKFCPVLPLLLASSPSLLKKWRRL